MKVIRGYKTELKPNNKQKTSFIQYSGMARYAWNWALNRIQEGISRPNAIALSREWNYWKKENIPWWTMVSTRVPEKSFKDIDTAFKLFFRKCKLKKKNQFFGKSGYPKFKSHKNCKKSFTLRSSIIKVDKNYIKLPRLGKIRLKECGYIPKYSKILSATISEKVGRWFVSVKIEEDIPEAETKTEDIIGIDLGIKTLATCSDGITFENPKSLKTNLQKLKKLQRSISRKQKGSKNRKKSILKLAKYHFHIANIRKDKLHKITAQLAKTKSTIVIEDLNVSGMMKNHNLAQAISDVGFYEFRRQLEYKGKWYGCQIAVVDRFFPSSKLCSVCGNKFQGLALSVREWKCESCGTLHDRDLNAAKNLGSLAVSSTESLNACGEESSDTGLRIGVKLPSVKQEKDIKSLIRFL